jgi:hypothetical protein
MLDKQTRGAILLLRRKGHSLRCISRLLSLSRDSVRKVVRVGSDEPPIILRPRNSMLTVKESRSCWRNLTETLSKYVGHWPTPVRPSDIQR